MHGAWWASCDFKVIVQLCTPAACYGVPILVNTTTADWKHQVGAAAIREIASFSPCRTRGHEV